MLAGTGFDAADDILGITVNRWPHGYAYEFNPLYDDFSLPPDQWANIVGRRALWPNRHRQFGFRLAAYTDSAIDRAAHRPVLRTSGAIGSSF